MKHFVFLVLALFLSCGLVKGDSESESEEAVPVLENDWGASREALRTDDEVVKREEEAILLDGLNVAQFKELRQKAENFAFQTEVNRMMKLIVNSLYRNKEIFLRELISNASDALDKIRLLSLTDKNVLHANPELNVRIKTDKEAGMIHIVDTGIGMTKNDLVNNLGTIAKSGTAEFLNKMQDATTQDMNDMIGQFGVGFYSAFLVADSVIVTTKHNEDKQYIWESDSASFSIVDDPRGDTLKRGTTISLKLKPEAKDFLEHSTIRDLVKKYSQFINFPIYLWTSRTEQVEEPIEEESEEKPVEEKTDEEDAAVEEEKEEKPKTKKIDKTTWDWELLNDSKPIWTRKPAEITDDEYNEFYKSLTKDTNPSLTKVHFVAEGEVTFKALLFIPSTQPSESFNRYGAKTDHIKLFVRRVFITDEFNDMIPSYLAFIRGVVDSDDLPLNVSRETLQQHKLIKVIKKKLVRKVLDVLKKLPKEDYLKFWKEYSTNIKLGLLEDPSNRTRLAKLLMFYSSAGEDLVSLAEYVQRMKPKQERIYYITGATKEEVASSPFVERVLRKNYEVLYLIDPVDEYAISGLPDFDGKKFQNLAKEGFSLNDSEGAASQFEQLKTNFEPLTKWLSDSALSGQIAKATISERLSDSPCALVASVFGWTGNMERLSLSNAHQKSGDPQREYYRNQRKTLEINPRHPLMKELLRRVNDDVEDPIAKDMALMLYRTATLRSGYILQDTLSFAESIEKMMRKTLGVSLDEQIDEEEDVPEDGINEPEETNHDQDDVEEHDEL